MSPEELWERAQIIIGQLKYINGKINNLDNNIVSMDNKFKKNLLINDVPYNSKEIIIVREYLSSVIDVVNNEIIPSLNNRM